MNILRLNAAAKSSVFAYLNFKILNIMNKLNISVLYPLYSFYCYTVYEKFSP